MMSLKNLFWDMVEVKEDMKCCKIPDKGALCTFPVYDISVLFISVYAYNFIKVSRGVHFVIKRFYCKSSFILRLYLITKRFQNTQTSAS